MASKTITIKTDVYNRLVGVKGHHESFSSLFQRMLREKQPDLLKFAGAWELTPEESERIKKAMKDYRRDFEESYQRRQKRLFP